MDLQQLLDRTLRKEFDMEATDAIPSQLAHNPLDFVGQGADGKKDCSHCDGTGMLEDGSDCKECNGSGRVAKFISLRDVI